LHFLYLVSFSLGLRSFGIAETENCINTELKLL